MSDTNTSATGGYLQPTTPLPPDAASFDAIMQALVVGIVGLPGNMVRPRWQPEPPPQPAQNEDWCGIGEVGSDTDGSTYGQFQPNSVTGGSMVQSEWDNVEVLASFYGPNGFANAKLLRAGLFIAQNREALNAQGIAFTGVDKISRVPELVNMIWMDRSDIVLTFNRVVGRTYNILSFTSLNTQVNNSVGLIPTAPANTGA